MAKQVLQLRQQPSTFSCCSFVQKHLKGIGNRLLKDRFLFSRYVCFYMLFILYFIPSILQKCFSTDWKLRFHSMLRWKNNKMFPCLIRGGHKNWRCTL